MLVCSPPGSTCTVHGRLSGAERNAAIKSKRKSRGEERGEERGNVYEWGTESCAGDCMIFKVD